MISADMLPELKAKIKVIGVGGGGGNAVDRMVEAKVQGIEFISANTDNAVLLKSKADKRIQLGEKLTKGLGAGGKSEVGKKAAEESREDLIKAIDGANMLFVTAGMGGGTGTGAAPIIAGIARDLDILTIGVVTKPFEHEGRPRMARANAGIEDMLKNEDALVVIPNERLLDMVDDNTSIVDSFKMADAVLRQGIEGISDLVLQDGMINVDFADLHTVIKSGSGMAHMGVGSANGKNKMDVAVKEAIGSPLLDTTIVGAKALIINFKGDANMALREVKAAAKFIGDSLDPNAEIMFGTTIDDRMADHVVITVIATGLDDKQKAGATHKLFKTAAEMTEEDINAEEPAAEKPREELTPIRDTARSKDDEMPFEIPIFLQRKNKPR